MATARSRVPATYHKTLEEGSPEWPRKGLDSSRAPHAAACGATTTTEIYTDGRGKQQVRTVRKVCTACGGKGGYHV